MAVVVLVVVIETVVSPGGIVVEGYHVEVVVGVGRVVGYGAVEE